MSLREILAKELNENGILREELGEIIETKIEKTIKLEKGADHIPKEAVKDYLKSQGMLLTQKNYDSAEKMLQSKLEKAEGNVELDLSYTEREYVSHLDKYTDEELSALINVCVLKRLIGVEKKVAGEQAYEYAVCSFEDVDGALDVYKLEEKINEYAEKGYRVKDIFVNELGKSALVGNNTTLDQIVVVFERVKIK